MTVAYCRSQGGKERAPEFGARSEAHSNRPDVFQLQRRFLPDEPALVPRDSSRGVNELFQTDSHSVNDKPSLDAAAYRRYSTRSGRSNFKDRPLNLTRLPLSDLLKAMANSTTTTFSSYVVK